MAGTALPMDVPATVLAALGVPKPDAMDGVDLLAADRGRSGAAERPAFAHLDYERRAGVSVVLGTWKLIEPLTRRFAPGPELYDLERDPGERENLAESHPVRAGYLRTLVRRHLLATGGGASGERADLGPEARAGLEALGYL
jgi:arylsulfatase A-like enzyme